MQTKLNPYISFKGQAREAMEFYKTVFDGKLTMSTFNDAHAPVGEGEGDNIMHAALEAPNGITLMASDTPSKMEYKPGNNIGISLSGENDEELRGYWQRLSEGATVTMPLNAAPWGDIFGMLTDRFGINWLVNITKAKS